MIPILELRTQYAQIKDEVEEAVLRTLRSTQYILGPEVQAFEKEFAAWNNIEYGIGVANGTDAIELALRAVGVVPGDEVICPSFTFVATAGAVSLTGATPVFADIYPDTFTMDVEHVKRLITKKTKAIVAVHLYGHPADVLSLKEIADAHGIYLIEDCAQAAGTLLDTHHAGTVGHMGCYSFFPTKNLGGVGDGGIIITHSAELCERVKMLRGHGSKVRYYHEILGKNSRLDEIQAAVLRIKLKHVDQWNKQRRAIAAIYNEKLKGSFAVTPVEKPGCYHVYHQYTIKVPSRDALQEYLKENGVGSMIYYPISLHLQKTFADAVVPSLPVCEQVQKEVLSLPVYPELTAEQVEEVCSKILSFDPKVK